VSGASTSTGPCGVAALTPITRRSWRRTPNTSNSRYNAKFPCRASSSRKSDCGSIMTYGCGARSRLKSTGRKVPSP
jgi:hypothetical protein